MSLPWWAWVLVGWAISCALFAWGFSRLKRLEGALLDLDEEQTAIGRRVPGLPDEDRP